MKRMWVVFEGALLVSVAVAITARASSAADKPSIALDDRRISEDGIKINPSLIHPWDNPLGKDTTKPQGTRVLADRDAVASSDTCCVAKEANQVAMPSDVLLHGNYPNPFNAETRISFSLTEAGRAELRIYNILGQTVRAVDFAGLGAGRHEWNWDGKVGGGGVAPSGVYFYRVTTLRSSAIDRMVLLK